MRSNVKFILVCIVCLVLACALFFVGKELIDLKKDQGIDKDNDVVDNLNYDIRQDEEGYILTINGKETKYNYPASISEVKKYKDVVMYFVSNYEDIANNVLFIEDENRNIIAKYDMSSIKGNLLLDYGIENDVIYLESESLGQDDRYVSCSLQSKGKGNEPVKYTEKITYLGNYQFSPLEVVASETADAYIKRNNIDCSSFKGE